MYFYIYLFIYLCIYVFIHLFILKSFLVLHTPADLLHHMTLIWQAKVFQNVATLVIFTAFLRNNKRLSNYFENFILKTEA